MARRINTILHLLHDFTTQCFITSNTTEQQSLTHHSNPGQNIAYKSQFILQSS